MTNDTPTKTQTTPFVTLTQGRVFRHTKKQGSKFSLFMDHLTPSKRNKRPLEYVLKVINEID
jgi:hypothetical protein